MGKRVEVKNTLENCELSVAKLLKGRSIQSSSWWCYANRPSITLRVGDADCPHESMLQSKQDKVLVNLTNEIESVEGFLVAAQRRLAPAVRRVTFT